MKCITLTIFAVLFSLASFATIGSIQGDSSICVGQPAFLTDTTSGGFWSSSNTAVGTIDSTTGVLTGIAGGTTTVTYTVGLGFVIKSVTINPLPPPIIGPTTICAGETVTYYDSSAAVAYWTCIDFYPFYITTPTAYGVPVTGMHHGSDELILIDIFGCSTSIEIFVDELLTPITGNTNIHVDSTTTLSNASAGGVWSSNNMTVATVDSLSGIVTGISPGFARIYYKAPCTASIIVTVLPPVSIPFVCATTNNSIDIKPTLATSTLTIASTDKISAVAISNLQGQLVYTHKYDTEKIQIDIADLPTGVYFIRVDSNEVRRFVKQ
jgi:trimeric autotransporter adhesin